MKRCALLVNAARRAGGGDGGALVQGAVGASASARAVDVDRSRAATGGPSAAWMAANRLITPRGRRLDAWSSFTARFRFAAAQVRRFIAGEPLENVVTEAGY